MSEVSENKGSSLSVYKGFTFVIDGGFELMNPGLLILYI